MSDVESVERWRLEQFQQMGFGASAAVLLHEWQVDVHEARELVDAGCPAVLAVLILRPLEDSPAIGAVERIQEYSIT